MALFKCSECGNDISDQAATCPHCGNPIRSGVGTPTIQVVTVPDKPLKIEPELTSKKWKKVKLVGWAIIILGFLSIGLFEQSGPDGGWTGVGIAFCGLVVLAVGKIGAWYADNRTR